MQSVDQFVRELDYLGFHLFVETKVDGNKSLSYKQRKGVVLSDEQRKDIQAYAPDLLKHLENKNSLKMTKQSFPSKNEPIRADKTDIGSILPKSSEPLEFPILWSNAIERTLSPQDISIIRSYPPSLHELLTTLVDVRDGKYAEISLTQQDLENFRHNIRWFFVSIEYYIKGWHPADVRTLWSDGWRAQDIICFMASQKVKYLLCHNAKIIQCLDLNNGVYVFEKKRSNSSKRKPVEEVV